ncbi:hypothetical protein [Streptomyces anulatus]
MEEYVAGEDLVVLLEPVSEPLRVLLAGDQHRVPIAVSMTRPSA